MGVAHKKMRMRHLLLATSQIIAQTKVTVTCILIIIDYFSLHLGILACGWAIHYHYNSTRLAIISASSGAFLLTNSCKPRVEEQSLMIEQSIPLQEPKPLLIAASVYTKGGWEGLLLKIGSALIFKVVFKNSTYQHPF